MRITENLARRLADAGARGLSLSLDALDPDRHDPSRKVRGAWRNTVEGAAILVRTGLPFIVQTTARSHNLGELDAIADFAHDRLAAKVWNLCFLVPTGRGQFVSDMTPAQYDDVLASLYRIQRKYARPDAREREVRAALHQDASGHSSTGGDPIPTDGEPATGRSPGLSPIRTYSGGPAGARRERTTWGYDRTGTSRPAPTSPVFAGSPQRQSADLWTSSELFNDIRRRSSLGGRCGACEMNAHCGGCRARLRDDRRFDGGRSAVHAHAREVRRVTRSRHADDPVRHRIAADDRVG